MSARFEIVRTDAAQPWHARFVAANGRIVWTTENYTRKGTADAAIAALYAPYPVALPVRIVDERGTGAVPDLDDAAALGRWALTQRSIRDLVESDKKIGAIRELRIATGATLYQAKRAIIDEAPR